jgi:hypothetical protein
MSACPVCHTAIGQEVRKAIFSQDFLLTAALTLAPFPVFVAIVGSIYFWFPADTVKRQSGGGRSRWH